MIVAGRVSVPGDKSISHRALIFGALARGTSRIHGILDSADVRSTAGVLRTLGVAVPPLGAETVVEGRGTRGLYAPTASLECGNSGTTTRLMAGVVAAHPFAARFEGDASLSRRPMGRVARPLSQMGAEFGFDGEDGLPMTVRGGTLCPLEWTSAAASAQVKSSILLAGLSAGVRVAVHEPRLSRDHSERLLAAQGARVVSRDASVVLDPTDALTPLDLRVPGDPSSAAFFAALAAMASGGALELVNVCLNPTRTGFLDVLRRAGAAVTVADVVERSGEPVGTVHVGPGALRAVTIAGDEIPSLVDEVPVLACLAARAEGETRISGAGELRVKESDRIAAVVEGLRAVGVECEESADGMTILGSDRPLRGHVRTHGDHRLAMAFGVLGALPGNAIEIDDAGCVAVSYPNFWEELQRVTRRV